MAGELQQLGKEIQQIVQTIPNDDDAEDFMDPAQNLVAATVRDFRDRRAPGEVPG